MNQAQGANNAGLTHAQIQQLNDRFRGKKDLYEYFDRVLQVFLPREKSCSIAVSATTFFWIRPFTKVSSTVSIGNPQVPQALPLEA